MLLFLLFAYHARSNTPSYYRPQALHTTSHSNTTTTMSDPYSPAGTDAYSAESAAAAEQGHQDRYPCTVCSLHFSINQHRAMHMRSHHGKSKPWPCRECPKEFAHRREYEAHARAHARSKGKEVNCDICDFAHPSSGVLFHHKTFDHAADGSHVSQCSWCDYKNASCCAVSIHTRHSHPGHQLPKPKGLPTPPLTPERQPQANSRLQGESTSDAFLRAQEAAKATMSPVEREAEKRRLNSRARTRFIKNEERKANRPARE